MGINIAFISACGGTGCTSASRAFARICSKLLKKQVIVLSLDMLSAKTFPASAGKDNVGLLDTGVPYGKYGQSGTLCIPLVKDDHGVFYIKDPAFFNPLHSLTGIELTGLLERVSELFDLSVIDIPFNNCMSEALCMCCEKTVVVSGYLPSQRTYAPLLLKQLKSYAQSMPQRPQVVLFALEEDKESFTEDDVDIHDQFGAEVRKLAEELFGAF